MFHYCFLVIDVMESHKHKDKNKNTSVFYVQNNMHTLPDLSEHALLARLSKS